MPIVEVEIVLRPGETIRQSLPRELAEKISETLAAAPGSTWVKLKSCELYAENAPQPVYPVFVSILKAMLPDPTHLKAEAARLTTVIAPLCNRPEENVHILYLPEASGRISFGGKLFDGQ